MYNLKNVCVAISFDIKRINLVVSDNANGAFNLLYSTFIPNNLIYNTEKILEIDKLRLEIINLINKAEKHLELKIDKILISFDGLVNDFEIHQIKTDFFTYKNPQKVYGRISKAINNWNKVNDATNTSKILWWQPTNWIEESTRNLVKTKEIIINSRYMAKINVYKTNNILVQNICDVIKSLNLEIINISLCSLNLATFVKEPTQTLILEIHDNHSHLLFFENRTLQSQKILNFGEKALNEFILKSIDNEIIPHNKIDMLLNSNLNSFVEKEMNLAFKPGSTFGDASYVKTTLLSKFIEKYNKSFIDAINQEFMLEKIPKIIIVCKSQLFVSNLIEELVKINIDPNNITYSYNNLMLLDNKYYSAALAIIKFYKDQKIYQLNTSCVQPYYSNAYDKKIELKLATMAINNQITKAIQKIIK